MTPPGRGRPQPPRQAALPAAAPPRPGALAAEVHGLAALLDVLALTLRGNGCSETLAFAFDHVPGEHTVTITPASTR